MRRRKVTTKYTKDAKAETEGIYHRGRRGETADYADEADGGGM